MTHVEPKKMKILSPKVITSSKLCELVSTWAEWKGKNELVCSVNTKELKMKSYATTKTSLIILSSQFFLFFVETVLIKSVISATTTFPVITTTGTKVRNAKAKRWIKETKQSEFKAERETSETRECLKQDRLLPSWTSAGQLDWRESSEVRLSVEVVSRSYLPISWIKY